MEVEMNGYVAKQAPNNHIWVYKNGDFVSHVQCDKPMTKTELLNWLENRIKFMQIIWHRYFGVEG